VERFLARIWGEVHGFVFLPKKSDRWIETPPIRWPGEASDSLLDQSADQYFCPIVFKADRRLTENAKPTKWLYADLDAVNPKRLTLLPTIAWQTSPGRYQALWELDRRISLKQHQDLNRRLTYAVGADRGGWHLTKVLRVPGTFNFKYQPPARVRILWSNGPIHKVSTIQDFVKGIESHDIPEVHGLILPAEETSSIIERAKGLLDHRGLELLTAKQAEVGERSDRLWELECRLIECGLSPEETFVIVRETVWNKFKERERGDEQLWSEVNKAHLHTHAERSADPKAPSIVRVRPRVVSYTDLMGSGIREPDWLIEDWWTLGSHGVVAGLPKSYKSLVSLDMGVSVSSETPFLGQFPINPKGCGPILVVQQENSKPLIRDRLTKITASRGLVNGKATVGKDDTVVLQFPPALPMFFYNDFAFDMTIEDDRAAVEGWIQKEGMKMVIFDPLYLMIGGADEASSKDMRPILSWLLRVRNLYNCAVVVIHHWGKGHLDKTGRGAGGIKLLGSTTIYGWLEAGLYLEATPVGESVEVVVEREFRERLSPPPTGFRLTMGDIGDNLYEWSREGAIGTNNRILWFIQQSEEGATYEMIQESVGVGRKKAIEIIGDMVQNGFVRMDMVGKQKRFYAN
jgi:hypothetical protein